MKLLPTYALTLCILLFINSNSNSQSPCLFDEIIEYELNETPNFQFLMEQAEKKMLDMMDENTQAIMNNTVYIVPVVFHIIHRGESIGSPFNMSETQVLQALFDLNSDFRDYPIEGNDAQIEFCLAQRDPQGNSTFNGNGDNITGIQRVNGTGTGNYENVGITRFANSNEVEVKALSNWPNTDYLNIWIVHEINGDAVGYATFPVADDAIDGIVLEAQAAGTPNLSKVISHEAGHFFNLYHTFQGSSSFTTCPEDLDCSTNGDMICDTRPHPFLNDPNNWFPCTESEYQTCNSAPNDFDVTENHMNYTDNDCRDEFTPNQVTWMRCALMALRPTLMNSLGCEPGCTDVTSDFTASATYIEEGTTVTFTNQSINQTSHFWEVDEQIYNSQNLNYPFNERGVYDVCLTASNPICVNRKCIEIRVIGFDPCYGSTSECDLLLNGDFYKTNFIIEEKLYLSVFDSETDRVCDWTSKNNTADLAMKNGILASRMFSQKQLDDSETTANGAFLHYEGSVTESPIQFKAGKNYLLEFDYLYAAKVPSNWDLSLKIGLAPTSDKYIDYSIDEILHDVKDGPVYPNDMPRDLWKTYSASQFEHASLSISVDEDTDGHLFFNNEGKGLHLEAVWIFIKDIKITCDISCIPIPDFTFDEECPNTFVGTNSGDGDIFKWEFNCDGFIANGQTVTRDFPAGTECEVCLTASCDLESSATICKFIIIPEDIPEECMDDCLDLNISANTCEQVTGKVNEYITNFTITIPTGSGPCGELPLQSNSTTVGVDLISYIEVPIPNTLLNEITIGMSIKTPPNINIIDNSVAAGLTLCDPDGNIICYNIKVSGEECESCFPLEFSGDVICIDDNPVDGVYNYMGSIDMSSLPPGIWASCNDNDISSEVEFNGALSSSSPYAYNFNLNTSNPDISSFSALLCFINEDDEQWCVSATINIPERCAPTPENCAEEWATKDLNGDCEIVDGQIKYTFVMENLDLVSNTLQSCNGEMWAMIEGGGSATVNSGSITGDKIKFNIDIFMPCDFDQEQASYDLRIIVCDNKGDMVCLLFPLEFPKCDLDCEEDGKKRSIDQSLRPIDGIKIFPNPSSQYVYINIPFNNKKDINNYIVSIYDPLGRLQMSFPMVSGNNKINLYELKNGLFLVKIKNLSNPYEMSIEKLILEKR